MSTVILDSIPRGRAVWSRSVVSQRGCVAWLCSVLAQRACAVCNCVAVVVSPTGNATVVGRRGLQRSRRQIPSQNMGVVGFRIYNTAVVKFREPKTTKMARR